MIEKSDLIIQLISKKLNYCSSGETVKELWDHFDYEVNHGEVVWIEEADKVIAFCDFSWISTPEDADYLDEGGSTDGPVLFIMNVWCSKLGLLWKLKRMLPPHRWIAWRGRKEEYDKIYAPKGWPIKEMVA